MTFAFYKPFNVLSQFTPDHEGQRTLAEFFPEKNIWPVGRLDADSEGLLLLTDDKGLIFRLLEPRFGHRRTYLAQVEGLPTEADIQKLRVGIHLKIDGKPFKTAPAEALLFENEPALPDREPPIRFRKDKPTAWIQLTLKEGKNRQVRRMCAAIGFPVLRLVRVAIDRLEIKNLQPGERREVSASELRESLRV